MAAMPREKAKEEVLNDVSLWPAETKAGTWLSFLLVAQKFQKLGSTHVTPHLVSITPTLS